MSWMDIGALFGRQIMSPREMSRLSVEPDASPTSAGYATSTGPLGPSMAEIVAVNPLGSTMISSPTRIAPPATVPA